MSIRDVAICIRAVDYSDTSQVVTLFTADHGKVSAIPKGAKRKKSAFDGPIELFSYGDISFISSETSKLSTLSEFTQRPMFLPLRRKLFGLNCAMFAAELIMNFTDEGDQHKELFEVFVNFLEDVQLSDNDNEATALLVLFQLSLLKEIGLGLTLKNCANCSSAFTKKWGRAYFSSTANGLICPDCDAAFTDKQNVQLNASAAMADLYLFKNADAQTLMQIEKILIYHFTELLHKPPKMAKHFLS